MRVQEICELELAARELQRAIKRASIRIKNTDSNLPSQLMDSAYDATELTADFLHSLSEICKEDSDNDLKDLLIERSTAPGWEAWCRLLSERLISLKDQISPIHIEKEKEYSEETEDAFSGKPNKIKSENPSSPEIIKIKATA